MTQPEKPEAGQSPTEQTTGSSADTGRDSGTVRIAIEETRTAESGSATDSTTTGSSAGSAVSTSSSSSSGTGGSSTGPTGSSTGSGTARSAKDNAEVTSSAPPPWQRVASDVRYAEEHQAGQAGQADEAERANAGAETTRFEDWGYQRSPRSEAYPDSLSTERIAPAYRPVVSGTAAGAAGTVPGVMPGAVPGAAPGTEAGRTTVNLGVGAAGTGRMGAPSALRRPGRGPRRASLQVKRVDPWSVLKLAFVLSVALFFVWLVAVGVLYGVLDGMGVWDKLNGTYTEFAQSTTSGSNGPLITAGRVFGIAAVIGAVNIVLITALATVGAFVYNVSADLAGGLEVTLAERE